MPGQYRHMLGLAALVLTSTAALAQEQNPQFMLVAYSNGAGGADLAGGSYVNAARAVDGAKPTMLDDGFALENNRCVAYTMTRRFTDALKACDAAVSQAIHHDRVISWAPQAQRQAAASAAVAYSNRAVVHWLVQEFRAARQDLSSALALAPDQEFVSRNLAATRARENDATAIALTAR